MNLWFLIIITAAIPVLLKLLFFRNSISKLPPGPISLPIISTIIWLKKSTTELEAALRMIRPKFGPIVTIQIASRPFIFVSSRSLAHEALVQNGAIFANRPKALATTKILTSNQHNITSAGYGPTWRLLRRNLTSQILHPARAKDFSHGRKWVLDTLVSHLSAESARDIPIKVANHFHFAMFGLLVYMCFGHKLEESDIRDIEALQHRYLTSLSRFQILNIWPSLTKILLRSRWNELYDLRAKQEKVLAPHIRAREQTQNNVLCYVDTLMTLELSEDINAKRKLTEKEMVTACSEFFNAGTDSTSTALQWIMANLVKNPQIQDTVLEEIKGLIGEKAQDVTENELSKMTYLKAVVLEGLRRHPPAHFVLPHAVTQETELGGYVIPENAIVNFTIAEMGRDPDVWEDPMEFKPERFLTDQEEFDVTGSREIKMMPFGVGRRICPGIHLAMLHLEYYVANLVWKFKWRVADGYEVGLSEKEEFTTVMKHPLHVSLSPRQ